MDSNNNELDQGEVKTRLWILDCLMKKAANIKREHHIIYKRNSEALKKHAADIVLLKDLFSQKRSDEFSTLEEKLIVDVNESEAKVAQIKEFDRRFIQIITIFIRFREGLPYVPGLEDTMEAFSKITESYYNEEEDPDQPGM